MLGDNFWLCVEALAEAIDDNPIESKEALNQTEGALRQLNRVDRDEMRRCMLLIVAELDRVEVRMKETDGLIQAVARSTASCRRLPLDQMVKGIAVEEHHSGKPATIIAWMRNGEAGGTNRL